ncbi:MAG: hypothetical protein K8S99_09305 [Planctomycetes bacterium]|nr:hypothetical protein [Planctomycetota bacterium]
MRSGRACRWSAAAVLALMCVAVVGCKYGEYIAQGVAGGDKAKTVAVDADYRGLDGKRTAVLVAADEMTLFSHPGVQERIGRAVSAQLAQDIPGITLTDPGKVAKFQLENPYWNTLTYGDMLRRLNVDRLVYIDLTEFSTHEPGNSNVWKGTIVAGVSVAEADTKNPDNLVYSTKAEASFPADERIGVLDADDQAIQAGMMKLFAARASNLFHDHKKVVK